MKHRPALRHAGLPAFMAELRARDDTPSRYLEFAILTNARADEARVARGRRLIFANGFGPFQGNEGAFAE